MCCVKIVLFQARDTLRCKGSYEALSLGEKPKDYSTEYTKSVFIYGCEYNKKNTNT